MGAGPWRPSTSPSTSSSRFRQAAGPSTSTAAPRPPGTSTPPSRGGSSGSPGTPGSAPGSSPSVLTTSESINKPLLIDNVQQLESKNFKNFQNKTLSTSQ